MADCDSTQCLAHRAQGVCWINKWCAPMTSKMTSPKNWHHLRQGKEEATHLLEGELNPSVLDRHSTKLNFSLAGIFSLLLCDEVFKPYIRGTLLSGKGDWHGERVLLSALGRGKWLETAAVTVAVCPWQHGGCESAFQDVPIWPRSSNDVREAQMGHSVSNGFISIPW